MKKKELIRKIIVPIVVCALGMIGLTGCSKSSPQDTDTDQNISATVDEQEVDSSSNEENVTMELNEEKTDSTNNAWGPERKTFTWEEPADFVTFNSITDNPGLGDERNFVRIRKADTNDKYSDNVTLEPGQEYEVYIYYHNNASASLDDSGKGMAQNVRLRMEQPGTIYKDHAGEIKGIISSTNADPGEVWDCTYAKADTTVLCRYVPNSAMIHNGGNADGSVLSSDAMFGEEGVKLAYSTDYWGFVPGCNEYAGYITYRFKVESASDDDKNANITWGPERKTFTWEEPADFVTFNSITDNPGLGDERNFVRIRKADTNDKYSDDVNLEPGQEYEVYIYFHNNIKDKYNQDEFQKKGIAEDVRVRVEAPGRMIDGGTDIIKGIVSAQNAEPQEVWDVAYMHSNEEVTLQYVTNSTVIHSGGTADGMNISGEALLGEQGVMVGYFADHLGLLPGCNEYAGYITYRFKVDKPGFSLSNTVTHEGSEDYTEKIVAKPGDILTFKIEYENTGTVNQMAIKGYDKMPNGLEYIKGSTYLKASSREEGGNVSDKLFNGGMNLGDYKPGDTVYVTYNVLVVDDETIFPKGDTVVYNDSSIATANGTGYDKVEITVRRE